MSRLIDSRRSGRGRTVRAILVAGAMIGGVALAVPAAPANAVVFYCGSAELDSNVFQPGGPEGDYTNPLNWSRHHTPAIEKVCIPGGTVALVPDGTQLVAAQVDRSSAITIEGTLRIQQAGAKVRVGAIYGATSIVNGGVIQILNGSTLSIDGDQAGAVAMQNIAGGQIQISAGSTLSMLRPLLNNGTVDITGGGNLVLNDTIAGYGGSGVLTGGQLRVNNGVVNFGGGALSALFFQGIARGTIGANQTLEMACEGSAQSAVYLDQGLVNNGTVLFRRKTDGTDCQNLFTLPGGQTLTNNGTFTVGEPGPKKGVVLGTNVYNPGGEIVNGPTGTMVLNGYFADVQAKTTNNGTITVGATGTFDNNYSPLVNAGTFVNRGGCDVNSLTNTGLVDLANDCRVRRSVTLAAGSTLRVHSSANALSQFVGLGEVSTVAGALDVVTDAGSLPPIGSTRDLIGGRATGTFSSVTSQSNVVGYVALYPGNKVQLKTTAGSATAVNALVPSRLLDTRPDGTTYDGVGQGAGLQAAGATIEVQVAGRSGVPADAAAAVLNVTVTDAQAAGFVTVWPCGTERPNASSLNYVTGSTVPNGVIAKIGAGGKVCLFVSNATHLLVDVAGFFSATAPYAPIVPARLLDTRADGTTFDGQGQGAGSAGAGSVTEVQVTGRAGVPADAAAVVLNVTVTEAQGAGFITVWPCGTDRPLASSLNYVQGSTVPNNVIAKIGTSGKVCLYASNATQLLADVGGFFRPTDAFQAILPSRLLDTRANGATIDAQGQAGGIAAAGSVTEVQVTGRAGVPANATAAVLNVTVTEAQGAGFITVWPCGTDRPLASSLNYVQGSTVPNGVLAKIGANGKVCLYASNGTHLLADVAGYFTS